ncbi:hypothetical protein EVAR_85337_1 [Eumeta japonica]|uniref:Uncharacterized protein n=1 Tax=Eumeta variegata TaxID=151549 RepID=A0A4C1WVA9_EUMVA|nr:hypothetical protein EVAR_85337_1 [Eumeta japonica]
MAPRKAPAGGRVIRNNEIRTVGAPPTPASETLRHVPRLCRGAELFILELMALTSPSRGVNKHRAGCAGDSGIRRDKQTTTRNIISAVVMSDSVN